MGKHKDAGAFWNVVPSRVLRLDIPSALFVTIAKWWLGLPVIVKPYCPACGGEADIYGYHALTCRFGGRLGVRHNAINNVLFFAARAAHLSPSMEDMIHSGTRLRSDLRTRNLGVVKDGDVAVTNPLRPLYVRETASGKGPSAADRYAKEEKVDMYTEVCKVAETVHVPLVLDCFGNWCATGRAFLEEIAMAKAALAPCVSKATHLLRLIQQCSVALMLYNARTLHKARGATESEATFACTRFDDADDGESDSEDEGGRDSVLAGDEGGAVLAMSWGLAQGEAPDLGLASINALKKGLDSKNEWQAYDRLAELARRRDDLVQFTSDKCKQPKLSAMFTNSRVLDKELHLAQVAVRSVLLRGGTGPHPEDGNPLFDMSEYEADPVPLSDDVSKVPMSPKSRDRELRIATQFASWGQQAIAEAKEATEADGAEEEERRLMEEEWEKEKAERRRVKGGTGPA